MVFLFVTDDWMSSVFGWYVGYSGLCDFYMVYECVLLSFLALSLILMRVLGLFCC